MRRALLASGVLALTLGLASEASADYSAKVDKDTLNIVGDDASDKLTVFVDSTNVLVDVGEDGSIDFTFDRAAFTAISVKAQGGDDQVRVQQVTSLADEAITVDGGSGNDTLIGGFMAETLIGGSGNDVVDGNLGADTVQLGSGNDTFNWDPGDSNDTVEGQGGTDVLTFNGSNIGEALRVAANGSRVTLERNIANIVMDLDGMERIKFLPRGGTDAISVEDVTGTDLDVVEAELGGDDTPDSLTKRGTEGPDAFKVGPTEITGVGARTTVTSADATGDVHGIAALGGDDTLATGLGVGGTAVVTFDGGGDDDTVNYSGTNGPELIGVVANGVFTRISSPPFAETDVIAEHLNVLGRGDVDTITGVGNLAALTSITMDGGSGNDILRGCNGADTLIGGSGNDDVDGQQGTDTALLGSGNDMFQWDPGDGNDTVDGQAGADALTFNGSAIGEVFNVSANGSRVNLTRNIANITTDLVGMERTMFIPRGGADVITVEDLTGTDMDAVEADFTADGAADSLISRGTEGPDAFKVGATGITGVGARTRVINGDTDRRLPDRGRARRRRHDRHRDRPARPRVGLDRRRRRHRRDQLRGHGRRRPDRRGGQRAGGACQLAARQRDRRRNRAAERARRQRRRSAQRRREPGTADRAHDGRRRGRRPGPRRQRRRHAASAAPATTSSTASRAATSR